LHLLVGNFGTGSWIRKNSSKRLKSCDFSYGGAGTPPEDAVAPSSSFSAVKVCAMIISVIIGTYFTDAATCRRPRNAQKDREFMGLSSRDVSVMRVTLAIPQMMAVMPGRALAGGKRRCQ
jgi:hypothetical protein